MRGDTEMKTVTKTFYIDQGFFQALRDNNCSFEIPDAVFNINSFGGRKKIQISWQEPERSIEITESDCVARLMKHNWYSKEDAEFICSRIFGAENEF